MGLLLGLILGGGGVWAALTKPWKSTGEDTTAVADAGPDAAPGKGRKKHRRHHRGYKRDQKFTYEGQPVEVSAADRALVWSGPAVSLPPRNVDFSGDGGRPLEQGEIDAGVATAAKAVVACIGEARGNAELSATITLKMLVGSDGRVQKQRVRAPRYLQQHGLYKCVSGAVRRMRFAATGAPTVVTVPFELN